MKRINAILNKKSLRQRSGPHFLKNLKVLDLYRRAIKYNIKATAKDNAIEIAHEKFSGWEGV